MAFEISGKLVKTFPTENKSATFQAREFVIEIMDGNYAQYVKFQLTQDRCPLIEPFKEGEEIKVWFDLRGREWQGKYFTNLNAWRVEGAQAGAPQPAGQDPFGDVSFPEVKNEPQFQDGGDDDLPF